MIKEALGIIDELSLEEKVIMILNENVSEEVLRGFANDPDKDVRALVAFHHRCPEDVLRDLAKDKESFVRVKVAKNENCPEDVFLEFMVDEDEKVRDIAVIHCSCPENLSENDFDVNQAVQYSMGYRNGYQDATRVLGSLLEAAAEEIENVYGRETELSEEIRSYLASED